MIFNIKWRPIITSLIPIFVGSLLCAGMIEGYRNESSTRLEMMERYYRPFVSLKIETQNLHSRYLNLLKLRLSYRVLINQAFEGILNEKSNETKKHSPLAIESIFKQINDTDKEIKSTRNNLPQKYAEMFRLSEELAIITGTYNSFKSKEKINSEIINQLISKNNDFKSASFYSIGLKDDKEAFNSMQDLIEKCINFTATNEEIIFFKKLNNETQNLFKSDCETEDNVYKISQDFYEDLRNNYAEHMTSKFRSGVITKISSFLF